MSETLEQETKQTISAAIPPELKPNGQAPAAMDAEEIAAREKARRWAKDQVRSILLPRGQGPLRTRRQTAPRSWRG